MSSLKLILIIYSLFKLSIPLFIFLTPTSNEIYSKDTIRDHQNEYRLPFYKSNSPYQKLPLESNTKDCMAEVSNHSAENLEEVSVKPNTFAMWLTQFKDKSRWQLRMETETSSQSPYHFQNSAGNGDVIVHLFEWRWQDIAKECESYLGPNGFAGVQISPPNEHSIVWGPAWNLEVKRPWFERYRPVSYILKTRSGDEVQFEDMVRRCNLAGVRIYVDIVINHMCNYKDKMESTAGSQFDASIPEYLAVPYYADHFNSKSKCGSRSGNIENYVDVQQLRNCRLLGLNDLDQSKLHVQEKIVEYLDNLIDYGVAGFRVDAAKHIWPNDLQVIYDQLQDLNATYFPPKSRPFIYQEVTDLGLDPISAAEYTKLGRVTEFKFGIELCRIILNLDNSNLTMLKTLENSDGFLKAINAQVFVDNHDTQRGHGAGEDNRILTFRDRTKYIIALAFMLIWPYGVPSLMSSYNWPLNVVGDEDLNNWIGPPHDADFNILPVDVSNDGSCLNGWVCEHRWEPVRNMVKLRMTVGKSEIINWWDNGNNQIAFARAGKAFFVLNLEEAELNMALNTGLPAGIYCDVLSGRLVDNVCTGDAVTVDSEGKAYVRVSSKKDIPALAIHLQEMIPVI